MFVSHVQIMIAVIGIVCVGLPSNLHTGGRAIAPGQPGIILGFSLKPKGVVFSFLFFSEPLQPLRLPVFGRGSIRTMMLTGDYHQTAIAAARGVGILPSDSQLIIVQARSELQSTAQPTSYVPSTFDSSHSLKLPAYPVVGTLNGSGKSDGQKAGSSRVFGSNIAGSIGGQHASFTKMDGTTKADSVVRYDPVSPFGAAQEQPVLQKASQQHSSHQLSSQEQSCQQGFSQQRSLHKQSYQFKLSRTGSSVYPLTVDTAQTVSLQQDTVQVVHHLQRSSCENLVFMLQSEADEEEIDAQHAITSLAQVDCPCTQCLQQCCLAPHVCLVHLCCFA